MVPLRQVFLPNLLDLLANVGLVIGRGDGERISGHESGVGGASGLVVFKFLAEVEFAA